MPGASLRRGAPMAVFSACATLLLPAVAGAYATANGHDAVLVAQTGPQTFEQGDVATAQMQLKNTGVDTWNRWSPLARSGESMLVWAADPVLSGERPSAFAYNTPGNTLVDDGSWIGVVRATTPNEMQVFPTKTATLPIKLQAPQATGVYHESFLAYAEVGGGGPGDSGPFGPAVTFDWTVITAEPPTVAFDRAPDSAVTGTTVAVSIAARDNLRVASAVAQVGGQTATLTDSGGGLWGGNLDLTGIALGPQVIRATATDPGGRQSAATRTLTVTAPAPPAAPCATGLLLFATGPSGPLCGPSPVPPFTFNAIAQRGRALRLRVFPTSRGDHVSARCVKGCGPHARVVVQRAPKGHATTLSVAGLRLRAHARFEVRVALAGRTTRYARYRVTSLPATAKTASGCRVAKTVVTC